MPTTHRGESAPGVPDLSRRLRAHTAALHERAERSGFVRDLLGGRVTRAGYALWLRCLHPAYVALETALARHAGGGPLGVLADPALRRVAAIESDLGVLAGAGWAAALPLLPAGAAYAARIGRAAAAGDGGLLAHAYVRHLGDLSGGRILHRRLAAHAALPAGCLGSLDFPDIEDPERTKAAYRAAIDAVGAGLPAIGPVLEEAAAGFTLTIAVAEAVADAVADHDTAAQPTG